MIKQTLEKTEGKFKNGQSKNTHSIDQKTLNNDNRKTKEVNKTDPQQKPDPNPMIHKTTHRKVYSNTCSSNY